MLGLFTRLAAVVAIVMNVNFLLMNGLHANSGGVDAAFIAGELLLLAFASVQALSLDAVLARNGVGGPLMSGDPARVADPSVAARLSAATVSARSWEPAAARRAPSYNRIRERPFFQAWTVMDHQSNEREIGLLTRRENVSEVALLDGFFNHLSAGFNALSSPLTPSESGTKTLLLATMAYNSLRWAFELMLKGYYTQANSLSRMGMECWVNALYLLLYPDLAEDWKEYEKRPRPKKMRERVADKMAELRVEYADVAKESMGKMYGAFSEYVHPNEHALAVLVEEQEDSTLLRLGGAYDRLLFIQSVDYFCYSAQALSTLMPGLLAAGKDGEFESQGDFLHEKLSDWRENLPSLIDSLTSASQATSGGSGS